MTNDKIERLIFIRFLLSQAEKQIDLDRPMSSSAILTLHDAVECFLQLSYEHLLEKPKPHPNFTLDNYVEQINKNLSINGETIINKSFIKRLNDLRNQLKHTTVFIDIKNIYNSYIESKLFFEDFTSVIFNKLLDEISLVTLISDEDVKKHLSEAETELNKGNLHKSLFAIGKGFYEIKNEVLKGQDNFGINLISKYHRIDYLIKYEVGCYKTEPNTNQKNDLREIANDINRLQDDMYEIKKVLSITTDLKTYFIFEKIIPRNIAKYDNEYYIPNEKWYLENQYSKEQIKFCFDFVTKLALKNC